MCIIFFAVGRHPKYSLIVAANRDEYKDRPALPLHVWPDGIVAGRDVSKSGTWLGVHPGHARLTFLTNAWNVDNDVDVATAPSRGHLLVQFLTNDPHSDDPRAFLEQVVQPLSSRMNGFNLVVADLALQPPKLAYLTNGSDTGVQELGPGQIYGLSNAALDTPWGKVEAGKAAFERIIAQDANAPQQDGLIDALIELMSDTTLQQPHSAKTHDTARIFVDFTLSGRPYGTRATTVVLVSHDGSLTVVERALDSATGEWSTRTERHQLGAI